MRWLADRVRGALNSGVEGLIWAGLVVVAVAAWSRRHSKISLDVTFPAWAFGVVVIVVVAAVLVSRRLRRPRVGELQRLLALTTYYASHVYDALEALQKVLTGTIPNVTTETFIEEGILQPAREFLMQRPGEDVRLSVLVARDGEWRMKYAAGYRLESRQRFSLPIIGSFSRHAYESGNVEWSLDLQADPRFVPHPQATRTYRSIISVPIRSGDDVIAVFNVDSTELAAFDEPDFVYVSLLGAIIGVVSALEEEQPVASRGGAAG